MLLIDEIDRADDEFEAFLLEVLADKPVTIPELGTIRAERAAAGRAHLQPHPRGARRAQAPLPLPLGRAPGFEREVAIVRRRLPDITERLAREVAAATRRLREADLLKPPGVAESIDWAQALHLLGARSLDPDRAAATLGAVLKYQEDASASAQHRAGRVGPVTDACGGM